MAVEQFANNAQTTLNGTINSGVTSLVVTSATAFPASGQFRIIIDSEIMLVTAVASTTFTVTRGAESTTAASHTTGAAVTQVMTQGSIPNSLNANFVVASGTNTYTATLSPAPTTYTTGPWYVQFTNANTTTATLNFNGIGAIAIQYNGVALASGQIKAGSTETLVYDGTNFQIVGTAIGTSATLTLFGNNTGGTAVRTDLTVPQVNAMLQAGTYVSTSGTNTYTGTTTPSFAAYTADTYFQVLIGVTNTTAATLNLNSIAAKAIQWQGAALVAGQLIAGVTYTMLYDGTQFQVTGAGDAPPQVTVFTSGSSTYTVPAGCKWLEVEVLGDGAGGVTGGGTSPVVPVAGSGSTVGGGTLTANGGAIGSGSTGGVGGTASGGDINIAGSRGRSGEDLTIAGFTNAGGDGGGGAWHGGGALADAGTARAGAANTGGGGAGGGTASATASGGGGGGGGFCKKTITNPAATYAYSVGGGGAGGTSTGGNNGGAGGSGIIIFTAYF